VSSSATGLWQFWAASAATLGLVFAALAAALVLNQRRVLRMQRGYSKKLLKAQEEERAWVAREVHDDALQRVAMVVHELHEWESAGPITQERQVQRVGALRSEIEDLAVMLRRVAHRLHPAIIDQAGLVPALNQLALDVSRASGIDVATALPGNGVTADLGRDRALILYRIAQEALRNVAKHAGVRRAVLRVEVVDHNVELTIADDGTGFDAADPSRAHGLGLTSMRERARLADGRFDVFSRAGQGTTVRVTIPQKA
jgi:signal transduction histidine kinase